MIELRRVCREDLPQIAAIERTCFSAPWDENILAVQLGAGYVFLAAAEQKQILGYVGMQYVLDEGYISNVAVSPEHRRRGIAGLLLTRLHGIAEELGLAFVSLEVRASNEPAIALYEKYGYTQTGRRKNYYVRPREDALIMTRCRKNEAGF